MPVPSTAGAGSVIGAFTGSDEPKLPSTHHPPTTRRSAQTPCAFTDPVRSAQSTSRPSSTDVQAISTGMPGIEPSSSSDRIPVPGGGCRGCPSWLELVPTPSQGSGGASGAGVETVGGAASSSGEPGCPALAHETSAAASHPSSATRMRRE